MKQSAFKVKESSPDVQGIVAWTVVLTAQGAMPVEFVVTGDRIVTRSGLRVLRAVSVQVLRRAALVRIGADTLGIGHPADDILVPAGQLILIHDWRAQAIFGTERGLVAARRLVDGHWIRAEAKTDVRLFTLEFDAPEVVYAGGLELGCALQTATA
jgi:hypothetical protein